jgi:NAD(P)H-dependent flavin oxidoreductase YrpB (nitropropane dioxygenase family)
MVWDLVLRLSGQVRTVSGPDRLIITGWDMAAALALAAALGVPARLAAEFLPEIEAAMVAAVNQDSDTEAPSEDIPSDE